MDHVIISYKKEHSFRERMLLWLLGNVVPFHAKVYRKRKVWGLRRQDLLQYAEGTLGKELGLFLERESLEPIARIERHDAFHILLGFTTSLEDEAAMQFFLIGNGKISPFTLATTIFTAVAMPDKWGYFYKEFKRGSEAKCIAKWDFSILLDEPFLDVKALIFKQPVTNKSLLVKLSGVL
jgi:ubiquinone biosynthesis protein Coq4